MSDFEWPAILKIARELCSQPELKGMFTMKNCTKKTKKLYRNTYEAYQFFGRVQFSIEQTVEAVAVQYRSFWRKEWDGHRLLGKNAPPPMAAKTLPPGGPLLVGLKVAKNMRDVFEVYKNETKEARRLGLFKEARMWAIGWKTFRETHDEFKARLMWELDHSECPEARELGRLVRIIEERVKIEKQTRIEEEEQPAGKGDSDPELTEKERKRTRQRPSLCRQHSDPQITEAEKARKVKHLLRRQDQDPYQDATELQKARRGKQTVREDFRQQMAALQEARKRKRPFSSEDSDQEMGDAPA